MQQVAGWWLPDGDAHFVRALSETPRGFELDHLDAALRHVRGWRVAVDGGAHVGTWTRAMAERFEQVHAFEPAGPAYHCLTINVSRLTNVWLRKAALGDYAGTVEVLSDPGRPKNSGSWFVRPGGVDSPIVTLDSLNLPHLDFLKLDVEGSELAALVGARETIRQHRPVLLVEVKDDIPLNKDRDPMAAVRFALSLGYVEVDQIRNDHVLVPAGGPEV